MAQQQPEAVPEGLALDREPPAEHAGGRSDAAHGRPAELAAVPTHASGQGGDHNGAGEELTGLAAALLRPYDHGPAPVPDIEPLLRRIKHRNPKDDLVQA